MRTGIATLAAAGFLALGATAEAQQAWKVQTSMQAGEFYYQVIEKHWLPVLAEMTEGKLKIELTPANSIVPYNETLDAVGQGVLQGDFTATVYFAGRNKAFAILGDLVAGYDTPDQLMSYCYLGGGRELLQELYDKYSGGAVKVIGCAPVARESFTAKVPVRTIDDLKGKKMRSPEGLTAEVFKRAGASTVALPASEVYTALEKGVVDIADFSTYTMDESFGLHKIAKYPVYPGIHSMPVLQFTVNKAQYDKLSKAHQTMLDVWYRAMIHDLRMRNDLSDRELVARDLGEKGRGIEVVDWSQKDRDALRKIARGAWEDFAKGDPLATKAYQSNISFMKKVGLLD